MRLVFLMHSNEKRKLSNIFEKSNSTIRRILAGSYILTSLITIAGKVIITHSFLELTAPDRE
jgi:hypothetical protein